MTDCLGVYISVPFCKAKCTYCNFASGVFGAGSSGAARMQQYVDRVCAEIRSVRADRVGLNAEMPGWVDTVYFGGGTPSLLSAAQMRQIFAVLRGEFEVSQGAEITLECAPGQMEDETLAELLRLGMNRVSFGVQSFVDREAAAVGRLHRREMCLGEIARVRGVGVENISVDLIVGLPHQTAASWRESVEVAIESGVPHASVYMLEVDEESRLGREMLASGAKYGAGATPSDDETAEWYGAACEWLDGGGLQQYEISNFAREGFRSRHNVKYWRREPYLAFGLDAHSMLRHGEGGVRWANTDDLEVYLGGREQGPLIMDKTDIRSFYLFRLRGEAKPKIEVIEREQGFEEALFLGLRMNDGLELERLRAEFGEELVSGALGAMEEVEDAGLVERVDGRVRLTGRGRMVSNEVFSRLLVGVVV